MPLNECGFSRRGTRVIQLPGYQIAKLPDLHIDAAPPRSILWSVPSTTTMTSSRLRVSDDVSKLVGETPMLQMKKLAPPGSADIFAKLEYLNPGGSVKDRIALRMIEEAEKSGRIKPGDTLIEPTSGNT